MGVICMSDKGHGMVGINALLLITDTHLKKSDYLLYDKFAISDLPLKRCVIVQK